MPAVTLTPADLAPFATIETAKAQAMIDDALALAARVAPCITDSTFAYDGAARAILRAAVLRWNDSGSGAVQAHAVGAVSQSFDTRTPRRSLFWPSEITALQELCSDGDLAGGPFAIDTFAADTPVHADVCSLYFGATYCSCGASLSLGWPLYEVGP